MASVELNLRQLQTEIRLAEMIKEKNELILMMYEEIKSLQARLTGAEEVKEEDE